MDIKKSFNEMSLLSPVLMLYTVAYMALMVYDFATRYVSYTFHTYHIV